MTPSLVMPAIVTGNVGNPHWTLWIMLYFFFGGIAGGAFLIAAISQLFSDAGNRPVVRAGYLIAFPLVLLCGLFLILDLDRPERFWHMLVNVTMATPSFKYWSPMSYGSWIIGAMGTVSFLAFVMELARRRSSDGSLGGLQDGPLGKAVAAIGAIASIFFVSYTGALLNATNQRIWGDNTLLGPLFAVSGISTGIAAIVLFVARPRATSAVAVERLERADLLAIVVELILIVALVGWLASAGVAGSLLTGLLAVGLWLGVVLVGLLAPLGLYLRPRMLGALTPIVASVFALFGGLALRVVILMAAHA